MVAHCSHPSQNRCYACFDGGFLAILLVFRTDQVSPETWRSSPGRGYQDPGLGSPGYKSRLDLKERLRFPYKWWCGNSALCGVRGLVSRFGEWEGMAPHQNRWYACIGAGFEHIPCELALQKGQKLRNFCVLLVNSVNLYQDFHWMDGID